MPWIIAVCVILLLAALAGLFIVTAQVIRRDLKDRFDQVRVRLERDANAVVSDLLNEHKPT